MARLGRLERPTLCSGGTRSIQLSYRRVFAKLRPVRRATKEIRRKERSVDY
jgi:hypothetical protein